MFCTVAKLIKFCGFRSDAVDSNEAPWSEGVTSPVPFMPWCPFPSADAASKNTQNLSATNGQVRMTTLGLQCAG